MPEDLEINCPKRTKYHKLPPNLVQIYCGLLSLVSRFAAFGCSVCDVFFTFSVLGSASVLFSVLGGAWVLFFVLGGACVVVGGACVVVGGACVVVGGACVIFAGGACVGVSALLLVDCVGVALGIENLQSEYGQLEKLWDNFYTYFQSGILIKKNTIWSKI